MGANKRWLQTQINKVLRQCGAEIVPRDILYEWQRIPIDKPCWNENQLPAEARRYLKPDNPRLIDLKQRYKAFNSDVTTPLVWTDRHVRPEDIAYFRGDNAWVWQVRGKNANVLAYAVSLYYLKSIDRLGLLDTLVSCPRNK